MTLIITGIIIAVALLAATHYATFSVAHRKGYDKASAEEVSLMADDLANYNNLLTQTLNAVEDLLTILDSLYSRHEPVTEVDDYEWYDWDDDEPVPFVPQEKEEAK